MAYSEFIDEFHGLPVVDFDGPKSWKGSGVAYRLREEYEDEISIVDRLDLLLNQSGSDQLTALIIGTWSGACEGDDSEKIVARLAGAARELPAIEAIFLGEITYEECEISWINHSDVTPLLVAFPRLQTLRIRGGSQLRFSRTSHQSLRELAIETGGLPRSVLREVFLCDLPNLEHLELLLGESNYGFDGSVEDLQPVLSGQLYPKLTFLGLMNSEIANDIAAVVVNSPIVDRISILDLSMGSLDDLGIQSLHSLGNAKNLQRLNITHHYGSEDAVEELKAALNCEVEAGDCQEPEDDWRPIVHAE